MTPQWPHNQWKGLCYHKFFSFTHFAFKQHPHQHIDDQKTITKPNFVFGKFRVPVPHGEIHCFYPVVGVLTGIQFHLKIHFTVFHVTGFEQHAGQTLFRPRRARNGACQGLVLGRNAFPIHGTSAIAIGTNVGGVQVHRMKTTSVCLHVHFAQTQITLQVAIATRFGHASVGHVGVQCRV